LVHGPRIADVVVVVEHLNRLMFACDVDALVRRRVVDDTHARVDAFERSRKCGQAAVEERSGVPGDDSDADLFHYGSTSAGAGIARRRCAGLP
jgi:hypothetical protein